MRIETRGLLAALSTAALTVHCATTSSTAPTKAPAAADAPATTAAPETAAEGDKRSLSKLFRRVLQPQMADHGIQMQDLLWGLVFLDRTATARIANEIAGSFRVARPLAKDPDLVNNEPPELFFAMQDGLGADARKLAAVAENGRPDEIAEAYGALLRRCVTCHDNFARTLPVLDEGGWMLSVPATESTD